jgi:NAD(P)-dependent dehydrogenase (short-subunit alcohol dehydrogenase family)
MAVLSNKVALVTGGTSGIGRAVAIALVEAGAAVMICGRREVEGAETVRMASKQGGRCQFVRADFSRGADIAAAVAATVTAFGRLDIAFNNAGTEGGYGRLAELTDADYEQVFAVNVRGLWQSMKHEIRQMQAQGGGGSIINCSSVLGHVDWGKAAHYTASKHAVEGYTKAGAIDYARDGIRVNAIAPGTVRTPMMNDYLSDPKVLQHYQRRHPMGRVAELDDITGAVVFLASDAARFITGVSLPIDGGALAT